MTFRDLTREQIMELQKRCKKEREQQKDLHLEKEIGIWNTAYNLGLKAGLEIPRPK